MIKLSNFHFLSKSINNTRLKRYFCTKKAVQVFNTVDNLDILKPIVTIGSFDGVHLGHRCVLKQLADYARNAGGKSVIITFWPHPASVLNPSLHFPLLSTLDEKIKLLEDTGIDYLIVLPFTKDFSEIEYFDFVSDYLVRRLGIDTLFLGYDNTVGRDGKGHFAELESLSRQMGFSVHQLEMLTAKSQPISSTLIRNLLLDGKVDEAATLLDRNYSISGRVVRGNHIGTSMGFPTANVQPDECKFIPGNGVYAVKVNVNGKDYLGMLNIGCRPTISKSDGKTTIEANLFGFNGDLYEKEITVAFLKKIRDERLFSSIDSLCEQLKKDCQFIAGNFK